MTARDEIAARNRALMPVCGRIVEEFRAEFGVVTIQHATEGELEIGKRADYSAYHVVHAGEMASVDDWIQRHPKEVAKSW